MLDDDHDVTLMLLYYKNMIGTSVLLPLT